MDQHGVTLARNTVEHLKLNQRWNVTEITNPTIQHLWDQENPEVALLSHFREFGIKSLSVMLDDIGGVVDIHSTSDVSEALNGFGLKIQRHLEGDDTEEEKVCSLGTISRQAKTIISQFCKPFGIYPQFNVASGGGSIIFITQ